MINRDNIEHSNQPDKCNCLGIRLGPDVVPEFATFDSGSVYNELCPMEHIVKIQIAR